MTQTAKHTPGPWEFDGDGFDNLAAQDIGTAGYVVFARDKDGEPDEGICEVCDRLNDDEAQANAALIAAAPETAAERDHLKALNDELVGALEKALSLPYIARIIDDLGRGIGTKTKDNVWAELNAFLAKHKAGGQ